MLPFRKKANFGSHPSQECKLKAALSYRMATAGKEQAESGLEKFRRYHEKDCPETSGDALELIEPASAMREYSQFSFSSWPRGQARALQLPQS
jgi:hypothetical protein